MNICCNSNVNKEASDLIQPTNNQQTITKQMRGIVSSQTYLFQSNTLFVEVENSSLKRNSKRKLENHVDRMSRVVDCFPRPNETRALIVEAVGCKIDWLDKLFWGFRTRKLRESFAWKWSEKWNTTWIWTYMETSDFLRTCGCECDCNWEEEGEERDEGSDGNNSEEEEEDDGVGRDGTIP